MVKLAIRSERFTNPPLMNLGAHTAVDYPTEWANLCANSLENWRLDCVKQLQLLMDDINCRYMF